MTVAMKAEKFIVDACVLQSFATVDRLDLLEAHCENDGTWTRAVQHEVKRGVQHAQCLERVLQCAWLGEPVDIPGDIVALIQVEAIRKALGGQNNRPTEHLGEAETIYYIETVRPTAVFVTDDRPAADFAQRRGIRVMNSAEVLRERYRQEQIGCPDAYELLQRMAEDGRGVYLPPHGDVC